MPLVFVEVVAPVVTMSARGCPSPSRTKLRRRFRPHPRQPLTRAPLALPRRRQRTRAAPATRSRRRRSPSRPPVTSDSCPSTCSSTKRRRERSCPVGRSYRPRCSPTSTRCEPCMPPLRPTWPLRRLPRYSPCRTAGWRLATRMERGEGEQLKHIVDTLLEPQGVVAVTTSTGKISVEWPADGQCTVAGRGFGRAGRMHGAGRRARATCPPRDRRRCPATTHETRRSRCAACRPRPRALRPSTVTLTEEAPARVDPCERRGPRPPRRHVVVFIRFGFARHVVCCGHR